VKATFFVRKGYRFQDMLSPVVMDRNERYHEMDLHELSNFFFRQPFDFFQSIFFNHFGKPGNRKRLKKLAQRQFD